MRKEEEEEEIQVAHQPAYMANEEKEKPWRYIFLLC